MCLITQSHYRGTSPCTVEGLAKHLEVPADAVESIIAPLEAGGLVIVAGEEPPVYVPAQAPGRIALKTLLDTVRSVKEEPNPVFNNGGGTRPWTKLTDG